MLYNQPMDYSVEQVKSDLSWEYPLKHKVGDSKCLENIHVYYDFSWKDIFGHEFNKFKGGLKLARLVSSQCPDGKTPALLLSINRSISEESRTTRTHYFVVVKIQDYLYK